MTQSTHIEEGIYYRVVYDADASLKLDRSKEVPTGAIVKALESAPFGSLDVIDVEIDGYDGPTVFAYQLGDIPIISMYGIPIFDVEV